MKLNEDTLVQQTTADYLHDDLAWDESIYAMDEVLGKEGTLGRESETEIVLTRYLGAKLMELNPGLPDEAYRDALRQITDVNAAQSMLVTNREKHELIKNGVDVVYRNEQGERKKKRLRVFDFDEAANNHFLVVRELWVQGEIYRRRADIVAYVNGIPLIFMEVKNLNKDVRAAFDQNFSDYKDTVPHLFHHNAIVVLGNGDEAKLGTLSSRYEHFHEWKRLAEAEPGVVDMETLLKGVCNKANLLDLFENFIVFDESLGSPIKILARNHQYLGVNRAIESVRDRNNRAGKLGVFWHTQGSGKSYSIIFFTAKIRRKLGGNFTFLVLTDREDLDGQIYGTFAGCGLADNDKDPCRAQNGKHLVQLLGEHKAFVFSLIQKFNKKIEEGEEYSRRDDIIVITDEAHRTQYGTLSLNMRDALPKASFIGFTGTPLFSDDEITKKVFGDYVSTYDFKRAVDDGATVPLYYDARGDKLRFVDEAGEEHPVADPKSINDKIAEAIEKMEIDDVDVTQRLEKELKREYHIITAKSRLEQIADDFVEHYSRGWESGKAMMVCIDKITCVRMYNLIQERWNTKILELDKQLRLSRDEQENLFRERQLKWIRDTKMAVVVSEEQGEVDKFKKWGLDITPHRVLIKNGFELDDNQRIDIETAFKKDDHPFRVAIVCAMWLTGFDVPTLGTMYLDKPLKAHTLMQAIARANRVAEGKNNGLVVDYCGILKNLRKALGTFAGKADEGHDNVDTEQDPAHPREELLAELAEAIDLVKTFLGERGFELARITKGEGFSRNAAIMEAKEAVNENDRSRKQFEVMARAVFKKFKACINIRPGINTYRDDRDAINIIYKSLQKDRDAADISDIIRKLHEIVDDSINVISTDSIEEPEPYDISKIDFDRLRREFERVQNKNTTVQNLREAIAQRLEKLLQQNPLRTDFQEAYEAMVRDYNKEKDRATIEKTFEECLKIIDSLTEEENRAIKEGLDEESLAVYDLIRKKDLNKKEIARVKKVVVELLGKIKQEIQSIDNWREKETTRDTISSGIFNYLFDEKTGLPIDIYTDEEIEKLSRQVYRHVYRVYPEVPSPVYS
ncbi:MAG: type I restriction endonuclease subunit R [Gammaproteobacteria bacterium]|nr:type I restriction endonuclease subunit R [Gammaproteobacteria bacterium]MDH5653179.1 type I restriction endonuclease subunit R [Gammaproteobacteria bacterium]